MTRLRFKATCFLVFPRAQLRARYDLDRRGFGACERRIARRPRRARHRAGYLTSIVGTRECPPTAAPTPNPDGSTPAGSLDQGKGKSTSPARSSCVPSAVRDLKSIIRERQQKTGESYTAARAHVMRERAKLLGVADKIDVAKPVRVEAAVLAVAQTTAIVRVVGEEAAISLRASGVKKLAPGQLVTLQIDRRWSTRGEDYASGRIEDVRIDVARLGLEPLPLEGPYVEDLRGVYENYDDPSDPYTALWQRFTAKPRETYEFDGIAWGAFPDADPDDNLTVEAVELREAGDLEGAHELLAMAFVQDLRCLDAHAHLGNWQFRRSPERAIVHYEIGMRIGELSAPENFTGILPWSAIYNRPFLRCLHGYGLCLWRLDRFDEAKRVFERILSLNPTDNQGVRFCWYDVCKGRSWKEMDERERKIERELKRKVETARRRQRSAIDSDPRVN